LIRAYIKMYVRLLDPRIRSTSPWWKPSPDACVVSPKFRGERRVTDFGARPGATRNDTSSIVRSRNDGSRQKTRQTATRLRRHYTRHSLRFCAALAPDFPRSRSGRAESPAGQPNAFDQDHVRHCQCSQSNEKELDHTLGGRTAIEEHPSDGRSKCNQ